MMSEPRPWKANLIVSHERGSLSCCDKLCGCSKAAHIGAVIRSTSMDVLSSSQGNDQGQAVLWRRLPIPCRMRGAKQQEVGVKAQVLVENRWKWRAGCGCCPPCTARPVAQWPPRKAVRASRMKGAGIGSAVRRVQLRLDRDLDPLPCNVSAFDIRWASAMAARRRDVPVRSIISITICHGASGVL